MLHAGVRGYHVGAILEDGSLQMWGRNSQGQLGDGTTSDRTTPVASTAVTTSKAVTHVITAEQWTIWALEDGTVKSGGDGTHGHLGDGSTSNRQTPVDISSNFAGGGGTRLLTAGYSHAIIVLEDGTIKMWGYNGYGMYGDGSTGSMASPVDVTASWDVATHGVPISIAASTYSSFVVLGDGTLKSSGYNGQCDLGDGTSTQRPSPITVNLGGPARMVAAGGYFACAVLQDGKTKCWGQNSSGEVGKGTTSNKECTPVDISASLPGTPIAMSGGHNHMCAMLRDESIYCWGTGGNGRLGNGDTSNRATPTPVVWGD